VQQRRGRPGQPGQRIEWRRKPRFISPHLNPPAWRGGA